MKTLRLVNDQRQWLVRYDEVQQTVQVEGPALQGEQIHHWLTTPKHAIDEATGVLLSIIPTQSWPFMQQVLEHDLYGDLRLQWVEGQEGEEKAVDAVSEDEGIGGSNQGKKGLVG